MFLFGIEIFLSGILFYSLKEMCSTKNENTTIYNYQPPPRYEEITPTANISNELPPVYN